MEDVTGHSTAAEPSCKKKVVQTILVTAVYFIFGLIRCQEGVAFLDLLFITNADVSSGSSIFSVIAFGFIIGALLIGPLFDKFNNDILYCACGLMVAMTTLVIPFCESLILMAVLFGVRSAFMGPAISGSSVMCARTWRHQAAPFLQNLQMQFALGGMVAPFVTEPFLMKRQNQSFALPPNISNLTDNFSLQLSLDGVQRYSIVCGENTRSRDNLRAICDDAGTSRVYIALLIVGGILMGVSVLFVLKIVFYSSGEFDRFEDSKDTNNQNVLPDPLAFFPFKAKCICYVMIAVNSIAYGCVSRIPMLFLMTFAVNYLGWSKNQGSLASTVFWLGIAIGRFLGIFLSQVMKPQNILYVDLVSLLVTFWSMLLADHFSLSFVIWFILFLCSGVFLGPVLAAKISWIDNTLTPINGKLMMLVFVGNLTGMMTHMWLLGFLFQEFTPLWFVYLLILHSTLLLLSFVVLCALTRLFTRQYTQAITPDPSQPSGVVDNDTEKTTLFKKGEAN